METTDGEHSKNQSDNFHAVHPSDTPGHWIIPHGGYAKETKFRCTQHKYAGGHGGYLELLEIHDGPKDKIPFVIHNEFGDVSTWAFYEYRTLQDAKKAWGLFYSKQHIPFEKSNCLRKVPTYHFSPWFYASSEDTIVHDICLPHPDRLDANGPYRAGTECILEDDNEFSWVTPPFRTWRKVKTLGATLPDRVDMANWGGMFGRWGNRRIICFEDFTSGTFFDETLPVILSPDAAFEYGNHHLYVVKANDGKFHFKRALASKEEQFDYIVFRGALRSGNEKRNARRLKIYWTDGTFSTYDLTNNPELPKRYDWEKIDEIIPREQREEAPEEIC